LTQSREIFGNVINAVSSELKFTYAKDLWLKCEYYSFHMSSGGIHIKPDSWYFLSGWRNSRYNVSLYECPPECLIGRPYTVRPSD